MKKKTKRALEESIAHWDRLRTGKRQPDEGISGSDCALCQRFVLSEKAVYGACMRKSGELCPIHERTGDTECRGSPYVWASHAGGIEGLDSKAFKREARKMHKFLISLREV